MLTGLGRWAAGNLVGDGSTGRLNSGLWKLKKLELWLPLSWTTVFLTPSKPNPVDLPAWGF